MSNHQQDQGQGQDRHIVDPRAEANGGRTPGAAGHPEPGSQHDDSKLETVAEGPDVPIVDGQPGAFGGTETVGGAATQTNMEGKATEVGS